MTKYIIRAHHETGRSVTFETCAINAKDALTSFSIVKGKQGYDFDGWTNIDIDLMEQENEMQKQR